MFGLARISHHTFNVTKCIAVKRSDFGSQLINFDSCYPFRYMVGLDLRLMKSLGESKSLSTV